MEPDRPDVPHDGPEHDYWEHHVNVGFAMAWIFLVVIVFTGFFIQARIIRDTQANTDAIIAQQHILEALVEKDQATTEQRELALCRLLLSISPDEHQSEISAAFSGMGVVCTTQPKGG